MHNIRITVPNCLVLVPVIDGVPDLSGYGEPTLSILQDAFDAGNSEIIPDPEPIVETLPPNWLQFYKSLKVSETYQYLIGLTVVAPNISGVMAAMGIAIQDGIRDPFDSDVYPAFQASVSGVIAALNAIGQPLTSEMLAEVRHLLDDNGFDFIQLQ
jgi:hypothetical protein